MRTQTRLALAMAVAAVTVQVHADTYTYSPSALGTSTNSWNAPATWGSAAFPNQAGDVADLSTQNISGGHTLSLNEAITVGQIDVGDTDGSAGYAIQTGTAAGSLTLQGSAASLAQINVPSAGASSNSITAPISLNSDLQINLSPSTTLGNKQALSISGTFTANGHTISINGGYKGASDATQITFGGADTLVGYGTIINNSDSPMVLSGQKLAFTGTLIASGQGVGQDGNTGTITLTGASVMNAAEIVVNGHHDGTTQFGGKLQIGTGSTLAVPANQRLTQNRITMNGGLFHDGGVPLTPGNYTTMQADTVANLDFDSGFSLLNVTASATTAGNILTATSVGRGDGATAFYRAANTATSTNDPARPTGYTYYSRAFAGNGSTLVVGSTATSGTATRVIPWMVASTIVSNLGFGNFATYDAAEGIRPLRAGEFASALTAGANMQTGNYSNLAQDWTFNAVYHNGGAQTPNPNAATVRTITINSGGLILARGAAGSCGFGNPGNVDGLAGVLNFPVEAVIINNAASTGHISSKIIAPEGLTKGGFGRLILTGPANEIAGPVHVGGGVLQIGDGTYDSSIGDGDVFVHAGAVLDVRVAAAGLNSTIDVVSDSSTLNLYSNGIYTGQANILAGVDVVGSLVLGDDTMPAGYYGSSTAAAAYTGTYTVTASDTYFAGAGVVHVVPEPAAVGMLSLLTGGLLLGRRRAR